MIKITFHRISNLFHVLDKMCQLLFHLVKQSLSDLAREVLASHSTTNASNDSSVRSSFHAKFSPFNRSKMSTSSLCFPDNFTLDKVRSLLYCELLHGHQALFYETVVPAIFRQIGQTQESLAELVG